MLKKDSHIKFCYDDERFVITIKDNEVTIEVESNDAEVEQKIEEKPETNLEEVKKILEEAYRPIITDTSSSNLATNDGVLENFVSTIVRSKMVMDFIQGLDSKGLELLKDKCRDRMHERYLQLIKEKVDEDK